MNVTEMRERQLNIRLSEDESERFERVARHFGLNIAATIRMLFKREDDALSATATAKGDEDDFRWEKLHIAVVETLTETAKVDPTPREEIAEALARRAWAIGFLNTGLPRALNALVRNGYVRRLKSGYRLTPKGEARAKQ